MSVATYRFYCMSDGDHIVHGADLDAIDLPAAIQRAYRACNARPFSSTRIEIWQGLKLLYVSPIPNART